MKAKPNVEIDIFMFRKTWSFRFRVPFNPVPVLGGIVVGIPAAFAFLLLNRALGQF